MKGKWKLVVIIIIMFCGLIYAFKSRETPDNLYIKMNEINSSQILIGLSKEEVVEILGEPLYEHTYSDNTTLYNFFAGKIVDKSILGYIDGPKYYELRVLFDEKDKVERSYIKLST